MSGSQPRPAHKSPSKFAKEVKGPRDPRRGPSTMLRKVALTIAVAAALLLLVPAAALAASSLNQVIDNLRVWIAGLLAALATVMLMIGGARYLAAGGDPGQIERAKGAIRAALAGYALALLAPVLAGIVRQIVG